MEHTANADTALVHVIGTLLVVGYAQNYYFHLREYSPAYTWGGIS